MTAKRPYNFSPGPSMLPTPALALAQAELLDFEGTEISILEHSHRGKDYTRVHEETNALIRSLMDIPDDYAVMWMQGGASGQFGVVPMNFLSEGGSADYIVTGTWGEKALAEAHIVGTARCAASTLDEGRYQRVPAQAELALDPAARYVHMTTNNTIFGTQFHTIPETAEVPLIADMSSDILSRRLDVSRFGLIYAGAQKNLGATGITLVIARRSLLEQGSRNIPKIFQYRSIDKADSLQNTIPTFSMYIVRNVLRWVKEHGGAAGMEARNDAKQALLYALIDRLPDFYRCPVEKASRSWMNVVFRLPTEELEQKFLKQATAEGLLNLKGHRSAGGIRVSMYNAMPLEGIEALCDLMQRFAEAHAS